MDEKALKATASALRFTAQTAYSEGFDSWAGQMNSGADMLDIARTAIAEARTIHDRLREAEYEQQCRSERAEYALAEAQRENEELRADVVWSIRNGANAGYDGNSWPAIWHATSKPSMQTQHGEPVVSVEYDGTDADLCRAIREARRGE